MREIDPMHEPSEALLSSALHKLASAGEHNAPSALEAGLTEEFRRHHQHRRRVQLMKAGALVAGILIIASLTAILVLSGRIGHVQRAESVQPRQQVPPVVPATEANSDNARPSTPQARAAASVSPRAEDTRDGGRFIALPSYDPAVPSDDLQMVRLEVTGSDLRLLGAPVAGDLAEARVTADFITDRDGTPYAVRIVR